MSNDVDHYLSDEIDPLFVAAARDRLLPELKHGRILNVGLGYGTWDAALSHLPADTVVGLDISQALVDHFRAEYPNICYVHADAYVYQPDAPYDTVIASHVLEHVDDPARLLRRFGDWLVPDGRILVVVPNATSLHRQIGLCMGLLAELTALTPADRLLGHRRVYTRALLTEHLATAGLAIRKLFGVSVKALSNAQLATLPRSYVEACARLGVGLEDAALQLAAVLQRRP